MGDLSALSDAELYKMAGIPMPQATATPIQTDGITNLFTGENAERSYTNSLSPAPDLSGMSNADLFKMAGIKQPPQTWDQAAVGGVTNIANAATANLGDELIAALSSPLAVGLSQFTDKPMGLSEAYNTALKDIRGDVQQFRQENPGTAILGDVSGAMSIPIGTSLKAGDGIIKTAAKLGAEGAGYGAAYGFGSGEGTLENRLANALESGAYGAGGGAALGAAGKIAAKTVKSLASNLPKWSQKAGNEAFNASVADFTKSNRQDGLIRTKNGFTTDLERHLNTLRKNGILRGAKSAEDILINHDLHSEPLAKELNKYLNIADRNLKGKKVYPKQFSHAENYIAKNAPKDEVVKLRKELQDYVNALKTEGNGSIRELQNQKRILYNKVYPEGSKAREGLDMAIAEDLKDTIELYTNNLLPKGMADAVKTVNKKLSPYEATRKLLELKVTQEATTKTAGKIKAFMRTSGGWGTPMLAGTYYAGIPGALAGAGLGKAAQFAVSPAGSGARAKLYEKSATLAKKASNYARRDQLLPQAAKVFASLLDSSSSDRGSKKLSKEKRSLRSSSSGNKTNRIPSRVAPKQDLLENLPSPKPESKASTSQPVSYTPAKIKELIKDLPPLVKAVIKVESNYNHRAVSPKGAQGLMQLMPANQKKFGVKNPNDPIQNINAGIQLLNEEMDRFKDNKLLALAAYNSGSPRVERAIKKAGSRSWAAVRPHLPKETQDYIVKVLREARKA